jgi:hypothetical protein
VSSRQPYGLRIEQCAPIYAVDLWSDGSSEKRFEGGAISVAKHANSKKGNAKSMAHPAAWE